MLDNTARQSSRDRQPGRTRRQVLALKSLRSCLNELCTHRVFNLAETDARNASKAAQLRSDLSGGGKRFALDV
jgi:hypothetical protein